MALTGGDELLRGNGPSCSFKPLHRLWADGPAIRHRCTRLNHGGRPQDCGEGGLDIPNQHLGPADCHRSSVSDTLPQRLSVLRGHDERRREARKPWHGRTGLCSVRCPSTGPNAPQSSELARRSAGTIMPKVAVSRLFRQYPGGSWPFPSVCHLAHCSLSCDWNGSRQPQRSHHLRLHYLFG
jgi:hypothetical protein